MALNTNEGNLEAVLSAVGEEINSLAGIRFTRLRTSVVEAGTVFDVETTDGWSAAGVVIIGAVVYNYAAIGGTILSPTLTGITHLDNGVNVAGAKHDHVVTSEVLDFSREFSALDVLRSQFFVETATGEALSTLGRNLGVPRAPGLEDDDLYRGIIQSLAYTAKGTMHALEIALTAFFGAGNFTLFEDLENTNNTVFITILSGDLAYSTDPQGRTFLAVSELQPYNSTTRQATTDKDVLTVRGVCLADEEFAEDISADRPSTFTEIRYDGDAGVAVWTYQGANEVTAVVPDAFNAGVDTPHYRHLMRIQPEGDANLTVRFSIVSGLSATSTDGPQWALSMRDGAAAIRVGCVAGGTGDYQIGLLRVGGNFEGAPFALFDADYGTQYEVEIRKEADNVVVVLIDGVVLNRIPVGELPESSTDNLVEFGNLQNAATFVANVAFVGFSASTPTDYWNTRGILGQTLGAAPTNFDTNSVDVLGTDNGLPVRIFGSEEANAEGGNNNFTGLINVATATADFTVIGQTQQRAFTEGANPDRVQVAAPAFTNKAFTYPDDLGKSIELIGGAAPGPHVIDTLLDPVTLLPLSGALQVITDVCEVAGAPGFTTESGLAWRLIPNFVNENPPGGALGWEMSATGVFTGPSQVETRTVIPLNGFGTSDIIVRVFFTVVLSAQALADTQTANDPIGSFHPFYLAGNPLGAFAAYIDELTAAGVIPEVFFG